MGPKNQLNVGNSIKRMVFTRKNKKVAISSSDLTIRVYDYLTCYRLNLFKGHVNKITALQMDIHDNLLYSSSMDCTIRVWDISKKTCSQIICFSFAVISLSLDPECNMLATCHRNQIGIYIWINKMKLKKNNTKLFFQELKKKVILENKNNKSTRAIKNNNQKISKKATYTSTNDIWPFKDDKFVKSQKILNKDVYNTSKMYEKTQNLVTLSRINAVNSRNLFKSAIIKKTIFEESVNNSSISASLTLMKTQTVINDKYKDTSTQEIKITTNSYKKNGNDLIMAAKIKMIRYSRKSYTTGNYESLLNILEEFSHKQNIKQLTPLISINEKINKKEIGFTSLFMTLIENQLSKAQNFIFINEILSLFLEINRNIFIETISHKETAKRLKRHIKKNLVSIKKLSLGIESSINLISKE